MSDLQSGKLTPPQPGQDRRLVDEAAFPAQFLQTDSNLRLDLATTLSLAIACANCHHFQQRSLAGNLEEFEQFRFGERAALPDRVARCGLERDQEVFADAAAAKAPPAERLRRRQVG